MTPEAGFTLGLPLLLALPPEVRVRLVKVAREKSPNASIREAQLVVLSCQLDQRQRLRVAQTIRWLAILRDQNQKLFEEKVSVVMPPAE